MNQDRTAPSWWGKVSESCGNLQHISEREPDDWEEDLSLHPTHVGRFS